MNAEQLTSYLEDLKKLKSTNEKELLSLIQKHPYCQSLHYMMVRKAQMEYSVNYERLLHLASTYATDRTYLYQLIHREALQLEQEVALEDTLVLNALQDKKRVEEAIEYKDTSEIENTENQPSDEPILELKSVEDNSVHSLFEDDEDTELMTLETLSATPSHTIEREIPSYESFIANAETGSSPTNTQEAKPTEDDDDEYELTTLSDLVVSEAETMPSASQPEPQNHFLATENTVIELDVAPQSKSDLNETIIVEPVLPQPKSSFSSWLRKFKKPDVLDVSLAEPVAKDTETDFKKYTEKIGEKVEENFQKKKDTGVKTKKKKKNAELIEFAEQSLISNDNIASVTLAQLLAEHGRKERAIHIYEKLMLHNPEKSLYFASEIERLKNTNN